MRGEWEAGGARERRDVMGRRGEEEEEAQVMRGNA